MFRLRILLAWILMTALPVQGFAAASMLFCGMGAQHHSASAADAPHDHTAMLAHADDEHSYTKATVATRGALPNAQKNTQNNKQHKCSICAACCNGVALVGLQQSMAVAPAAQAELAEPLVLIHTIPSPVPDKPPRA
nr:hypothetical protein [Rhodoferax sp.]